MSDDTDTVDEVDEAEQLIAQLLEAGYSNQQPGEETGDEGTDEGEPGDEGEEDDAETADEPVEPGETETPAGDEPNPAPPAPDVAEAPGPFDSLTPEEKAALLKVRSILTDNPDIAEGFDQLVKAKFEPKPAPLPPEIDPEDETSVRLWEQIQEVKAQNEAARVQSEAREKEASARVVQNDVAQAVDRFKVAHPNLTDEDINNIRAHTAAEVNIAGVCANYPNDPVEGIVKSMEIGSLTDPATRDKVLGVDQASRQQAQDEARKKKLNGLSGSSGSAPRTQGKPKQPKSWNEVSQRLTAELEKLGGV